MKFWDIFWRTLILAFVWYDKWWCRKDTDNNDEINDWDDEIELIDISDYAVSFIFTTIKKGNKQTNKQK